MSGKRDTCVIARYSEIALKRGNRRMFEEQLIKNIKSQLKHRGIKHGRIYRVSGRIIVDSADPAATDAVAKVFGISSASPAVKIKPDADSMKEAALKTFTTVKPAPESFRVTANRLEKKTGKTSQQLNEIIGQHIVDETGCTVKLKNPDFEISIDVAGAEAYVHTAKKDGPGGLPVGVSGKILLLLSGGIDSPVAAWMCMRRGCHVTMLHFLHEDAKKTLPKKLKTILDKLRQYHPDTKLVCIPASRMERELIMNVPAEYRIIVLRRLFLKVAEMLCEKDGYIAVASGDNVGQVASQTLANLSVISKATKTLLIRPLICLNKQEIVDLAGKIGTYETSIEEYTECCNFLVPRHPSTKADENVINELESRISRETLDDAVKNAFLVE
ncbi:MAG: tRNA uracil 4-sulfurtransferase ThiI [Candidatus Altiarchaeota archaeon]